MSDLEAAFDNYWRILDGPDLDKLYRYGASRRCKPAVSRCWQGDEVSERELLDLLLDVWYQWRHPQNAQMEKFNSGGLSVLEDVAEVLQEAGIIDGNGVLIKYP